MNVEKRYLILRFHIKRLKETLSNKLTSLGKKSKASHRFNVFR